MLAPFGVQFGNLLKPFWRQNRPKFRPRCPSKPYHLHKHDVHDTIVKTLKFVEIRWKSMLFQRISIKIRYIFSHHPHPAPKAQAPSKTRRARIAIVAQVEEKALPAKHDRSWSSISISSGVIDRRTWCCCCCCLLLSQLLFLLLLLWGERKFPILYITTPDRPPLRLLCYIMIIIFRLYYYILLKYYKIQSYVIFNLHIIIIFLQNP